MSLIEDLREAAQELKPKCSVCTWLTCRTAEERKAVSQWSGSRAALFRVCAKNGMAASETVFRRHFAGNHSVDR